MLIGEVARRSGVSARMLRHYDRLGLVRPSDRNDNGYREYSRADVERIFAVETLRSLGLSLHEVRHALDDPEFTPSGLINDLIAHREQRIERDRELVTRLHEIRGTGAQQWPDVLELAALLHGLGSDHPGHRQQAALTSMVHDSAVAGILVDAVLREDDPNTADTLRWALTQSGGGLARLAKALRTADPQVRRRAATSIAAVPGDDATILLSGLLADPDPGVGRAAALALGVRGEAASVATLVAMVVTGDRDVEAAEALGVVADTADRSAAVVAALTGQLEVGHDLDDAGHLRITQALAEIPGDAATAALRSLAVSPDRSIAATARSILECRSGLRDLGGVRRLPP